MVVRDVATRWNFTVEMGKRGLMLRKAIEKWTFETPECRDMMLSSDDWDTLAKIVDLLEPFLLATKSMSTSSQPTIPFVLPTWLSLRRELEKAAANSFLPQKIRNAASAGLLKLQKYESLAQKNQHCIIGTVLHPSLRSKWFGNQAPLGASDEERRPYESSAEEIVQHVAMVYAEEMKEAKAQTAQTAATANPPVPQALPKSSSPPSLAASQSWLASICGTPFTTETPHTPDTPTLTIKEEVEDELKRYFSFQGGPAKLEEPLIWWKDNAAAFPILAKMARDFLAIPATSTPVERVFSKSRHICSDLRSSLKAETISMALLSLQPYTDTIRLEP
ncbi:hypothetical protein CVT24_011114 [Panaeolus cyanescens]|uniref:HAT C-terminal dimerisation domain-containing protein n=1 Tax=Panaeolus cyanescens TaxID=181874 RepID=A0A409YG47_9AGAR|nr:hypothetical protein CVT24_011114 [Panaeolus cyanescens]